MERIKTNLDYYEVCLIDILISGLKAGNVEGLELERLVLIEWHTKNIMKFMSDEQGRQKFSFKPSEALALKRFMLGVHIGCQESHIDRQSIISKLERKLLPYERIHSTGALAERNTP